MPVRQQVDLRPDQVRDRERLGPGQHVDADVAAGGELRVHLRLDLVDEVTAHPLELEVHPAAAGLHVPAGHEGAVVAPDDAAQRVKRGVGSHQREPPRPVEIDRDDIADVGRSGRRPIPARGRYRRPTSSPRGRSTIGRRRPGGSARGRTAGRHLPGRRRSDRGRRAAPHRSRRSRPPAPRPSERRRRCNRAVRRHPRAGVYLTVSVPVIVAGWTSQTNG